MRGFPPEAERVCNNLRRGGADGDFKQDANRCDFDEKHAGKDGLLGFLSRLWRGYDRGNLP